MPVEVRIVGGNMIEIDPPKAPERPLFELFVRERGVGAEVRPGTKLIPRGSDADGPEASR